MMRKRALLTGVITVTMLTISTYGNRNATETTTAVEATTAMETMMEESTTEESTVTVEGMESEEAEDLAPEQIKSSVEEVQAAVAARDIGQLADLPSYPAYVSLEEGEGSEIKSANDSMAIGEDKLFTEKLMTQIADVKSEELEVFGAGATMGEDMNIMLSNVDGKLKIMGISL